ncbi:MAG: DUF2934 domain-containing protein [Nitrospiraceae bacterium]
MTISSLSSSGANSDRSNGNGDSDHDSHARIAELAYSFYEQDGYSHGHHLEHWLKAEQQMRSRRE